MAKKGGEDSAKPDDWGEIQARMTRGIISELRNDLEDLLGGLDAGSLGYIDALKALKIQLLEGLENPLVGAVEVKYRKIKIRTDEVNVPPALKKKRGKPKGKK
jgi:hypothetical protein